MVSKGLLAPQNFSGTNLKILFECFQNMVFFEKTIPGVQEAFLIAREAVLEKEDLPAEKVKEIYNLLKLVARANHERLFIIMTAHAKGWTFARQLDFYQSGAY